MKNRLVILAAATRVITAAFSDIDVLVVRPGADTLVNAPGRVALIEVLSPVASGTATVKRVRDLVEDRAIVETHVATNFTYTLVYSNGTEVVTNTVPYDESPFPPGMRYLSYTTNAVTVTSAVTNLVPTVILSVTNDVAGAITCSGGYGTGTPEGKILLPGDRLFFTGTATGKINVVTER